MSLKGAGIGSPLRCSICDRAPVNALEFLQPPFWLGQCALRSTLCKGWSPESGKKAPPGPGGCGVFLGHQCLPSAYHMLSYSHLKAHPVCRLRQAASAFRTSFSPPGTPNHLQHSSLPSRPGGQLSQPRRQVSHLVHPLSMPLFSSARHQKGLLWPAEVQWRSLCSPWAWEAALYGCLHPLHRILL